MKTPVITTAEWTRRLENFRRPWHHNYLAMYSSLYAGIVTDPVLMTIPIDDHMVHRADGVFDVAKCVDGKAYCLRRHLDRLRKSAAAIGLELPPEFADVMDIIRAAVRAGGNKNVLIRLMVSRGPGGFSTNPLESPAGHLYVIIHKIKPPKPEAFQTGVPIVTAPVPVKPDFFANIKSCDYLANVLLKKTAVEAGVDFAVNFDENGCLAEGSTENIILVSPDRELLVPDFNRVLRGITVTRVMELAEELVASGFIKAVRNSDINRDLATRCPEAMLCGTTLDVLPVTAWDGRPVGDGRPGPVALKLLEMMRNDVAHNTDLLDPMFD